MRRSQLKLAHNVRSPSEDSATNVGLVNRPSAHRFPRLSASVPRPPGDPFEPHLHHLRTHLFLGTAGVVSSWYLTSVPPCRHPTLKKAASRRFSAPILRDREPLSGTSTKALSAPSASPSARSSSQIPPVPRAARASGARSYDGRLPPGTSGRPSPAHTKVFCYLLRASNCPNRSSCMCLFPFDRDPPVSIHPQPFGVS